MSCRCTGRNEIMVGLSGSILLISLLSVVISLAIPVAIVWLLVVLVRRSNGGA